MNLTDELEALARSAPPTADPDVIVRLARIRRGRRTIGGSALLVLVVALPLWLWVDGRGDEPASARLTMTFTVEGPQGSAERARGILQERAQVMGFVAPRALVVDDRTIAVEAGVPNGISPDWLATPGRLQIRKVLRTAPIAQGPPSPQAPPSSQAPSSPAAGTPAATLDELKAKLGGAYDAAVVLTAPADADDDRFAAFATLTAAEIALLPPAIQFNVPTVSCDQLDNRPGELPAESEVVSCEGGPVRAKYLLDAAPVVGSDVAEATPSGDQVISLRFTASGGPKWAELTREAFTNTGGECDSSAVGDKGHCLLAFVIDGRTIVAPQIAAEIGPREQPAGVTLTPR